MSHEPRGAEPAGYERKTGAFATLKRTVTEFNQDQMTDRAAGLTYYGLLSLFPALIALVSIIGLVADPQETTRKLTEIVGNLGPDTAVDTFKGPVESITSNRGSSAVTLVVSTAIALFSASSYVGAFSRASNVIFETREGRPFWKLRPFQILVTLLMIIILALLALGLVLTGPVVQAVGEPLGIGSTALDIWKIAKWPVMAALVVLLIAVLYHTSPNVEPDGFKWFTPGAAVALVVWVLASAGFAFYVSQFGSYNKTYGALAGFVVLLVWFWISNLALLFGMELNSEIERSREFDRGVARSERELQTEPRDEPSPQQTV
jgi:membrane protein